MTIMDTSTSGVITLGACPVCGGGDFALYRKSSNWTLAQCRGCRLVFLNPQPDEASLLRLYEEPQYFSQRIGIPSTREAKQARAKGLMPALKNLNETVVRKGRLLEIGSGYGYLLAAAQMSGWETVGLELSPHAAAFARETFGLQIHESPASSLGSLDLGSFDAVLMFSVIEHLPNPMAVLEQVQACLNPGGVLWAVLPNIASVDRIWHGDAWSGWDLPYHLWHFSPATIQHLCKAAKFSKVRTENTFFNPIYHLRNGLGSGNLRADIRGASFSLKSRQANGESIQRRKGRPMIPHSIRCFVKRVLAERDMNVWAIK